MKRKLIKQGQGGLTITLPIKWIREYNLDSNPSQEIELTQTPQGILITAEIAKREKTINVDLKNYDKRMILNILNQSYRLGSDTIHIKYTKNEQLKIVEEIARDVLLGFEITTNKDKFCIIQNIAEPDPEKFDIIMRKVFLQILELSTKTTESLIAKEKSHQDKKSTKNKEDFATTKHQIDKLTNYCRRTVLRSQLSNPKTVFLYDILSKLSLISHAYIYLYNTHHKKPSQIPKEIEFHIQKTNTYLRQFYEAFYKKDLDLLNNISNEKEQLQHENDTLLEKSKGTQNIILAYAREIIRLIHMCSPAAIGYYLE